MSRPSSIVQTQLEHLLQLVQTYRDDRCRQIMAQAEGEAKRLAREAFGDARKRVHEAVKEQRERLQTRKQVTQATLQTRQRQRYLQGHRVLLDRGCRMLEEALMERWRLPDSRGQWIDKLFQEAANALLPCVWTVDYPVGWASEERDAFAARVQTATGAEPVLSETGEIVAGLRIIAQGALLDGSIAGVLYDYNVICARLLGEIHRYERPGEPVSEDQVPAGDLDA